MAVTASIDLGLKADPNQAYYSLSETDQIDFKTAFIVEMESATEGIPEATRSPWESYSYPSSSSHIPENDIAIELNSKLSEADISPDVSFRVNANGPNQLRYTYRGGKRYCYHRYTVQRELEQGQGFFDWQISKKYGSIMVVSNVQIEFSWPTTY